MIMHVSNIEDYDHRVKFHRYDDNMILYCSDFLKLYFASKKNYLWDKYLRTRFRSYLSSYGLFEYERKGTIYLHDQPIFTTTAQKFNKNYSAEINIMLLNGLHDYGLSDTDVITAVCGFNNKYIDITNERSTRNEGLWKRTRDTTG